MKIKIGNAYFFNGDIDKAVIVMSKTKKNVTYIFSDGAVSPHIVTIKKKVFKKDYETHTIKVTGFTFEADAQ